MSVMKKDVQELRRSLGLCIDCGGPIEQVERGFKLPTVRCAACRKVQTDKKAAYKAEQTRWANEAKEVKTPPRSVCETCEWVSYAGAGAWFCPLPVCERMKEKAPVQQSKTKEDSATEGLNTTQEEGDTEAE